MPSVERASPRCDASSRPSGWLSGCARGSSEASAGTTFATLRPRGRCSLGRSSDSRVLGRVSLAGPRRSTIRPFDPGRRPALVAEPDNPHDRGCGLLPATWSVTPPARVCPRGGRARASTAVTSRRFRFGAWMEGCAPTLRLRTPGSTPPACSIRPTASSVNASSSAAGSD